MQSSHFAVLRRVMDRMTALKDPRDIRLVLHSITKDLVERADMTLSAIWLYTTDDRCPVCQAAGRTGLDGGTPGITSRCSSDSKARRRQWGITGFRRGTGFPGG